MIKKIWLALLSFFCINTAYAQTQTLNVLENQKELTIQIPGNPTTGYVWSVKQYDKNMFQLTGSGYLRPDSKLIGAGGVYQFIFKILCPLKKQLTITFELKRPWEKEAVQIKTFLVSPVKERLDGE